MIPKKVKGNIGLIIKGYFNAPQDDIYTFALLSDDGSTLTIDSEQIVDNDGPHGPKEIVVHASLCALISHKKFFHHRLYRFT